MRGPQPRSKTVLRTRRRAALLAALAKTRRTPGMRTRRCATFLGCARKTRRVPRLRSADASRGRRWLCVRKTGEDRAPRARYLNIFLLEPRAIHLQRSQGQPPKSEAQKGVRRVINGRSAPEISAHSRPGRNRRTHLTPKALNRSTDNPCTTALQHRRVRPSQQPSIYPCAQTSTAHPAKPLPSSYTKPPIQTATAPPKVTTGGVRGMVPH